MSSRGQRVAAGLALIGAWAIFFRHALLTTDVPFERDILVADIPHRQFLQEWLTRGVLPQWCPYEMLGTPFVGSFVPATFHPQTLLLFLTSAVTATKITVLASYLAAELGAYRAARTLGVSRAAAIAAAFSFAFGGYALSMSNNLPYLVPYATLPWVFFAARRLTAKERPRDAALLSVLWALVALGGDLQAFCECVPLVVTAILIEGPSRRRSLLAGASMLLATMLAAVEIVPGSFVAQESFRKAWRNTDWTATRWALHPWRLPELIIAQFVPRRWQQWMGIHLLSGRSWEWASTLFAGSVPVWLAGAALRRRGRAVAVLTAITVLAAWFALGSYGHALTLFWKIFPVASRFRYPEKYLGLAWLTGSLLVAIGLDAARGRWAMAAAFALAASGLIVLRTPVVDWMFRLRDVALPIHEPILADLTSTWSMGLFMAAGWLVVAAIAAARRQAPAVAGIVFLQLLVGNSSYYREASREAVDAPVPWAEAILSMTAEGEPAPRSEPYEDGRAYRVPVTADDEVLLAHATMNGADSMRAGLSVMGEQGATQPERSINLLGNKYGVDPKQWSGRFNVCYRVADVDTGLSAGESIVADVPWLHLALIREPCRERAFVAGAIPVADEAAARDRMRSGLPNDLVVWEGGPALPATTGSVRWIKAEPNVLELEVTAATPAALVVSDAWASGWSAWVDGTPTPIWPTNSAVRGVAMPMGTHRVTMRYRAPGFIWGAAMSLLGLGICVMLARGTKQRTRHSDQ